MTELISAGIYGVPMDICTRAYWEAIVTFTEQVNRLKDIHLVNIDASTTSRIKSDLERYDEELNRGDDR